ncbi:MAG TPA: LpxD N-terminal domain-containing protein, partial [Chthoniobacterales bacterium]|nr:LpxD N-terminal domain-containing protein [Chthoniobacterales bacterium]
MVTLTLQELATMCGGELRGDSSATVTGAASLTEAGPGEITFLGNRRYLPLLRKTRASAAFVPLDFSEEISPAQIRVADPTKAFEQVVLKLAPKAIAFA